MRPLLALLTALALAGPAPAQVPDPADAAHDAARRLDAAARRLATADNGRNRVRALTETIQAYEAGLEAMREGLRRAAIREEVLARDLAARRTGIARLLAALQTMSRAEVPVLLTHPGGPLGTARAGMIVSDVAPALERRTAELRSRLQEVSVLRALQQTASNKLREGLDGLQGARAALSQAMADRTDLPRRFTADPVQTALLIASTETLDAFASGIGQIAENEVPGGLPGISGRKGALPLPVQGRILRRAGQADAAGITRPGIVIATPPRALVTTPAPATIRYRGPLLDYGNVIILEPEAGILLVFAGLDVVYGQAGEVVPGGSPVGLMGGADSHNGLVQAMDGAAGPARNSQTLYVELRQKNSPVDPETWFRTDKDD